MIEIPFRWYFEIIYYFCYPPLSDSAYHLGPAVDLSILSLHVAGVSSLLGNFDCLTCFYLSSSSFLPFNLPKVRGLKRIGPHNIDILSIIYGSLLGDGYCERLTWSSSLCLQQEDSNVQYIMWFHKTLSLLGYCSPLSPLLLKRIGNKGKIRHYYKLRTYSFSSFNWIHNDFYLNGRKRVPPNISTYLTPQALAIWIMDDGTAVSSGMRLCTNSFTKKDNELQQKVLFDKYAQSTTLHKMKSSPVAQYNIYIKASSMNNLKFIVAPFLHKSMLYKQGR